MASLLQITDITLTLNHGTVFHNPDFAVDQGEIHALPGGNGSGKSSPALTVKLSHPLAKVTDQAAIGSVDQQQLEPIVAQGLPLDVAVDLIFSGILRQT